MNVVAHNLIAMNSQRQFGINTKQKAKSTEKLSSGYKINRAADDAAGLAISEKMRRQIRGLRQGSDNIQDGISLVQVADGALNEVTECLQRINELSIKAYNGTNQKTDREYIQSEVSHLITEIGRIADTTTFNELQILKGNPTELVKVESGNEYAGYYTCQMKRQVPEWLKVSDTLNKQNSVGLTQLQKTDMYAVFQTAPGQYTYYGPTEKDEYKNLANYTYGGSWSETLDDNASAVIDFSSLTNVDDVSDLYNSLFGLMGTSIGVPCGTCTEYYGISYTGSEKEFEVEGGMIYSSNGSVASDSYLNLSTWKPFPDEDVTVFEKVRALAKEQNANDALGDDQKKVQVKELAAKIAESLCEESYKRISDTMIKKNHFDQALKIQDAAKKDFRIVIYDYRDDKALAQADTADSQVQTSTSVNVRVPYSYLDEGQYIEMKRPIWIQCSATADDKVPIDLPKIDNKTMGIEGYDVAFYREKTVYSKEYQEKLEDWEKNGCHYETKTITIPGVPESIQKTKFPKFDFSRDGEWVQVGWDEVDVKVPAIPERTITQQVLVEDRPKPQPGANDVHTEYTYEPDSVKKIADALSYVSTCRSNLGAAQNRLEHTYDNNMNKWENTSAAESQIRDTDMASEMVRFSNFNILLQAGQSLLAQANQSNQGVMNLLT